MVRVLVVGDDIAVARLVQAALGQRGFEAEATVSVHDALFRMETVPFDLVVVDRLEDGALLALRLQEDALRLGALTEVLAPTAAVFHFEGYPYVSPRRVRELVNLVTFAIDRRTQAAA